MFGGDGEHGTAVAASGLGLDVEAEDDEATTRRSLHSARPRWPRLSCPYLSRSCQAKIGLSRWAVWRPRWLQLRVDGLRKSNGVIEVVCYTTLPMTTVTMLRRTRDEVGAVVVWRALWPHPRQRRGPINHEPDDRHRAPDGYDDAQWWIVTPFELQCLHAMACCADPPSEMDRWSERRLDPIAQALACR